MPTLQTNQHVVLSVTQTALGVPITPQAPGYAAPNWTISDQTLGVVNGTSLATCDLIPTGNNGTATITATSKKAGSPDLVGTISVDFVGPIPDGLQVIFGVPVAK